MLISYMRKLSSFSVVSIRTVIVGAALLAGALITLSAATHVLAETNALPSQRLLAVHDRGVERGILTEASTIRQALSEAGIAIGDNDLIEPGIDDELVATSYQVNIYRARPVIIVDGQSTQKVLTPYQTSKQIVEHAGLMLRDEDITTVEPITDITTFGAGLEVRIDRAAAVTVFVYGKKTEMYTQEANVQEMLKAKNITLGPDDALSLPGPTEIVAGMTLQIWRNGKQTITEDQAIDFPVEKVQSADHDVGYKEVKTTGEAGSRTVTYEVDMKNGVELSRVLIQSITTKEPKKQVEIVGAKYKGSYTTPGENQAITWNYLIAKGFTREQTAGIMGNLMQEHGFKTTGDGIAQWTGGRKASLMSRPDPYNIYTQLDFMMFELDNGYRRVQTDIRNSITVEQAVIAFQNGYEKCGICAESRRIQYAYNILASH